MRRSSSQELREAWVRCMRGEQSRKRPALSHCETHVAVTTSCPTFVSTGMFAGARAPLLTSILTPEAAFDAAWRAMLRGRTLVLKPWTVKLGMAFRGVLPTKAWDVIADNVFHVYSSMDHFAGQSAPPSTGAGTVEE